MLLQLLEADNRQGCVFRRLQPHQRSDAIFKGLFPSRCTDTPVIPWFQAWELERWHRRHQIVALGLAVAKKLFGHHAADAVLTVIRRIGLAETIAVPPRHGLATASLQRFSQNVAGRLKFGAIAGHLTAEEKRSLPKDWHILTSDG